MKLYMITNILKSLAFRKSVSICLLKCFRKDRFVQEDLQ